MYSSIVIAINGFNLESKMEQQFLVSDINYEITNSKTGRQAPSALWLTESLKSSLVI